ncbi:MAG: hypothetical protein FWG45_06600 [Oscillospiraceae bacterium]|nr:hypothetical protein [Oscillospiraceae bacterium]
MNKLALSCLCGLLLTYIIAALMGSGLVDNRGGIARIAVLIVLTLFLANTTVDVQGSAFWAGLIVAVTGIAGFVLPVDGLVENGRLYGVFQYANAAGVFLAVCAFLTRLTEGRRRHAAWVMEAALLLTQSVGAVAVYVLGWAVYALFIQRVKAERPRKRSLYLIWGGMAAVTLGGLFILRGFRPFSTFAERLTHIKDGATVIAANPFGIGAGAWELQYRAYQSSDYMAAIPHCGYVQIGLAGGFAALLITFALIGYWLWRVKRASVNRYTIAALMILVHAAQDITFSFAAIVFLLLMCIYAAVYEQSDDVHKVNAKSRLSVLFSLPVIVFVTLSVPEAVKNRAEWAASVGEYSEAITQLERGFLLKDDTRATLLRMEYAYLNGDYAAVERAFGELHNPNYRAFYIKSMSLLHEKDLTNAEMYAILCIENASHWSGGHDLLAEIRLCAYAGGDLT